MTKKKIAIIGAGPAGLMAAETLNGFGYHVEIFERMPTAGRKFLMAGRGGLNLTHSENAAKFMKSYGQLEDWFRPKLDVYGQRDLRNWADELGAETFVGSSGRVFPKAMKASPLLRAWLRRLSVAGVELHLNHAWAGWDKSSNLVFQVGKDEKLVMFDATVLALGGASWGKLGSDGKWQQILEVKDVPISPFKPSNMGFDVEWSKVMQEKFAGAALKSINFSFKGTTKLGELVVTETGIEGGLVYAFSSSMREEIAKNGFAEFSLDLCPDLSFQQIIEKIYKQKKKLSLLNKLRKAFGLQGAKLALVEEVRRRDQLDLSDNVALSKLLKNLSFVTNSHRGLEKSISTAGGVSLDGIDEYLMIKNMPGVFTCGEMLDWEAPTGGYLLQGCFSSAVSAAQGVKRYLEAN